MHGSGAPKHAASHCPSRLNAQCQHGDCGVYVIASRPVPIVFFLGTKTWLLASEECDVGGLGEEMLVGDAVDAAGFDDPDGVVVMVQSCELRRHTVKW